MLDLNLYESLVLAYIIILLIIAFLLYSNQLFLLEKTYSHKYLPIIIFIQFLQVRQYLKHEIFIILLVIYFFNIAF